MPTRLRGPPKPRSQRKPDPPGARTFATFAAMMIVISFVIVGIGGVLHGFPTFSGPAEPDGADAGADDAEDGNGEADDSSTNDGEGDTDPLLGDDDDESDDSNGGSGSDEDG